MVTIRAAKEVVLTLHCLQCLFRRPLRTNHHRGRLRQPCLPVRPPLQPTTAALLNPCLLPSCSLTTTAFSGNKGSALTGLLNESRNASSALSVLHSNHQPRSYRRGRAHWREARLAARSADSFVAAASTALTFFFFFLPAASTLVSSVWCCSPSKRSSTSSWSAASCSHDCTGSLHRKVDQQQRK